MNNQKCQKIKLRGALTTEELKKQLNRTTRGEEPTVRQWTVQVGLAERETETQS